MNCGVKTDTSVLRSEHAFVFVITNTGTMRARTLKTLHGYFTEGKTLHHGVIKHPRFIGHTARV